MANENTTTRCPVSRLMDLDNFRDGAPYPLSMREPVR